MARPYRRAIPNTWWLQRWPYTKFMLREISSVFVAAYLVILVLVASKANDPAALQACLTTLAAPGWKLFHGVVLLFSLMHTVTWFDLTSKAMVIWRGEERVPGAVIAGTNYVVWVVVSVVIAAIFGVF